MRWLLSIFFRWTTSAATPNTLREERRWRKAKWVEKGKENLSFFLSLSFASRFFLYPIYDVRWELTHIAHGGWLPSLSISNTTASPILMIRWKKESQRDDAIFLLCFISFCLFSLFNTLKSWWPLYNVTVILAMVVDIAPQPQLNEVFTTNRTHHRSSSSTHRRNSATTNNTSSSGSNTTNNNTMTNGHRFSVWYLLYWYVEQLSISLTYFF